MNTRTTREGDTTVTTAPTACGGINGISSTGTGSPHAHRPHSDATPRPQLRQEASLTPPWHPAREPYNHRARTFHGTRAPHRERHSAHAAPTAAAATGQHHARASRPARRAYRARSHSTAARNSAAEPHAPDTTHERRRTTTKRCCVPARAQSRRRRSMGNVKTGYPPRQRQRGPVARAGRFPFPPMRAWLEQPHGRHHKAPPQSCTLTATGEVGLPDRPTDRAGYVRRAGTIPKSHSERRLVRRFSFVRIPRSP